MKCKTDGFIPTIIFDVERAAALVELPLKPILKALDEHPEGVSPAYFKNQEYEGIDMPNPATLDLVMKRSNAIVYRIELGQYLLMSAAHKTTLKAYTPMNTSSDSTAK